MAHLLATVANDADHMPALLYALRNELAPPPPSGAPGETWGVGYYAESRALTIRKPAELLASRSVFELASGVQSSVLLACVQHHAPQRELAPPHRFRGWLFGYSGDLDPLTALRGRVADRLPDFVKSELPEARGGMLAFAIFVAELHRASLFENLLAPQEAYAQAMARTVEAIRMLAAESGQPMPAAAYGATDGRVVLAARAGRPLHWKLQAGLEPRPADSMDASLAEAKRLAEALQRFRAIVLTGEVVPGRSGWQEVPEGGVLYVDRRLQPKLL